MGTWSAGIWADDVAEDLRLDLKDAYAFNDDETALSEIFRVNKSIIEDETDDDHSVFFYALADWLWDKGRLPEDIKQKVLGMLERKEGMERFYETEEKALIEKRLKVLESWKEKLRMEQPERKKISSNRTKTRYNLGDIIAFKVVKEQVDSYYYIRHVNVEYNDEFVFMDGKIQKNPYAIDFRGKVIVYVCVAIKEDRYKGEIKNVPGKRSALLVQYDYFENHYPTIDELRECGYLPYITLKDGAWKEVPDKRRIGEKLETHVFNLDTLGKDENVYNYRFLYDAEGVVSSEEYKKGGRYQIFERNIIGNDLEEAERFNNRKKGPLDLDCVETVAFPLRNYNQYHLWRKARSGKE